MNKVIKKILIFTLLALMVGASFGCKKKVRHKWIEVGSDPNPAPVKPGVHPERGSESDAIQIIIAPVYIPIGKDEEGVSQYKKVMYELVDLTPEAIDEAFRYYELIDDTSLFCDLVLEDSEEVLNAGPGASESQLTKKGRARYAELSTSFSNEEEYEGKYYKKDLKGAITMDDVINCMAMTFEENFQLVSCDIEVVDREVYDELHKG